MPQRILWTYEHPTARTQELMLFPAAGIEVVPTYSDTATSWLDRGYHDESHPLYPRWRNTCSLPVNVVERIRRSRLWERDFEIDGAEARLINESFDAIFVNCAPSTLGNILRWYRGKILFRCNGGPNRPELYKEVAGWTRVVADAGRIKDFIYLPGHRNLVVPEMIEQGVRVIHFPVFVDEARVPGKWAAKASNRIATAISYVDFHAHFQGQLADIVRAYGGSALHARVFGKNKVSRTAASNVEIVGGLPSDQDFWGQLFDCTAFVDAGADPTHTVFPPLEAAFKGMPVFFQYENGHAHAIRDCLGDVPIDERIGFLPTHEDICDYLVRHRDDLTLLAKINRSQVAVLKSIFSRENAISACFQMAETLRPWGARLFKSTPLRDRTPFESAPLAKLLDPRLPYSSAQAARLNMRRGKRDVGEGTIVCPAVSLRTREKMVICEYLPELSPGEYEIVLDYKASRFLRKLDSVGRFELGEWANGETYQSTHILLPLSDASASIRFAVDKANRHWRREVRVSVYTSANVALHSFQLRRIESAKVISAAEPAAALVVDKEPAARALRP